MLGTPKARLYVVCTRPDPTRTCKISYRVQSGGVSHTVQVQYPNIRYVLEFAIPETATEF